MVPVANPNPMERFFVWILPLVAIGLGLLFQYSNLDLEIVSYNYDPVHGFWPLKDHWLTQTILHIGVQHLCKLFGLFLLVYTGFLFATGKQHRRRKVLLCSFLSMVGGIALVGFLKGHTRIYCPWDLEVFGGHLPHVPLFQSFSLTTPVGHAFPAAHAAIGFSFVSLYFTCALFAPRWKYPALGFALVMGFLFGFVQQLRGAHFPSHDLFSLAICWVSVIGVHLLFFREKMQSFLLGLPDDVRMNRYPVTLDSPFVKRLPSGEKV
jgi:membrane-associated PAP2 superfamily phosphatase